MNRDLVAQLADALTRETAPEPDVSQYSHLLGMWHFIGANAVTLPNDGPGMGSGRVIGFGSEFEVTEGLLINSLDRNGRSELAESLDSEDYQIRCRSEIAFRRGPWPENALRTRPGTPEHLRAALEAKQRALRLRDASERAAELTRIKQAFGDDAISAPTSRSLVRYGGTTTEAEGRDRNAALRRD